MYNRRFIFIALIATPFFALPNAAIAKNRLSLAEVQQIFIGTPWHGPTGVFLFRRDGTYTYQGFEASKPNGTWSYELRSNGKINGNSTSYTFYRRNDGGFAYYHSRSGKTYRAIPNRNAPFK